MNESERLIKAQEVAVAKLHEELAISEAAGNELHVREIAEKELPAAKSLARLIHKAPYLQAWERNKV